MDQATKKARLAEATTLLAERLGMDEVAAAQLALTRGPAQARVRLTPLSDRKGQNGLPTHARVPEGWYCRIKLGITVAPVRDVLLGPGATKALELFEGDYVPLVGPVVALPAKRATARQVADELALHLQTLPALLETTCTPTQLVVACRNFLVGDPRWPRRAPKDVVRLVDALVPPDRQPDEIQHVAAQVVNERAPHRGIVGKCVRHYEPGWGRRGPYCATARTGYALSAALLVSGEVDAARTLFARRAELRPSEPDHAPTVAHLERALASGAPRAFR